MEKPTKTKVVATLPPNPSPSAAVASRNDQEERRMRRKQQPPSPEELVAHYESQGVESKEAHLKVIEDLQAVVLRVVSSSSTKKDKFMANTTRKLDNINTRLAVLEMKLDSKPGFPQALLAIGVSTGATASLLPHLAGAFARTWDAVRAAVRRSPST